MNKILNQNSFKNKNKVKIHNQMNFDAAVFSDQQCSGFGAIIRNSSGEVMAGMSVKGPYMNSSEEAEVLACRRAMEFFGKLAFLG